MRSLLLKEIPYITFTEDFARGFVSKCASQGLSMDQTIQLLDATRSSECVVKYATTKTATLSSIASKVLRDLYIKMRFGNGNTLKAIGSGIGSGFKGIGKGIGWGYNNPLDVAAIGGAGYGIHRYMQKDPTDITEASFLPPSGGYFDKPYGSGSSTTRGGSDPLKPFGELNNAFPPTQAGFQAAAKDFSTGRPKYIDQLDSINRAMASEKDAGRMQDLINRKTDLLVMKRDADGWSKSVGDDAAFKMVKNMTPERAMNLPKRSDLSWYNPVRYFAPTNAGKYFDDYKSEQQRLRPALKAHAVTEDYYAPKPAI